MSSTSGTGGSRLRLPPRPRRKRGPRDSARETFLLLLPALVPILLLSVYPLARGIYLGFTDAKAGLNVTTTFIGIDNFTRLRHNQLFWSSFKIGLIWAFSVTVLQFLLALGLALLLNLNLRLRWLARTLALIPWAMPPVVVAIMWRLILDPVAGPVNAFLRWIHLGGNVNWLGDFNTALPAAIVVGVWVGMPLTTITILAGLQSVDGSLVEAAEIDGANSVGQFRHIMLPALRPIIASITTLNFIWNFNSFGLIYVLTEGGPGGKTMVPMLFAYNEAFRYGNFGYAAAMGDAMVVLIVVMMLLYLRSRLKDADQ